MGGRGKGLLRGLPFSEGGRRTKRAKPCRVNARHEAGHAVTPRGAGSRVEKRREGSSERGEGEK